MKPTYFDIKTGRTVVSEEDYSLYVLSVGNWSCDCNRAAELGDDIDDELTEKFGVNGCFGAKRIIVIDVSGDLEGLSKEDALAEINQRYGGE